MKARHGLLDDRFTSVLGAKDVTEFRDQVLKFTKWLGFDLMNTFVAVDTSAGDVEFHSVDNAPSGYRQTFENMELGYTDPVMQHCKRRSTPIIWGQGTYLESGLIERWEHQAQFGYCAGVGVALHLPGGKHFMIGVDRDQPMPGNPTAQQRMAGDLCLFAAFAQEAAMRLLLPPVAQAPAVRLSARGVGSAEVDGRRQDGVGSGADSRHQRSDGHAAHNYSDAQAGVREQGAGRGESVAAGLGALTGGARCGCTTVLKP